MNNKKLPIPNCQEPLLLVNQRALHLMSKPESVVSGYRKVWSNPFSDKVQKDLFKFAHQNLGDDPEKLASCSVALGSQVEPIFHMVRCGHCALCAKSRHDEITWRCTLESQLYDCPPFFFTLTYNRENLPKNKELQYRDVQLFFKRYRKWLVKYHLPTDFRYLVSGEYGTKKGRPHYHVILFNNPYRCDERMASVVDEFKMSLWLSWQKDDWDVFSSPENFGQCYGAAAAYCAKYVGKTSRWDAYHVHKPFVRMSTGNGGLGIPYLLKFKGYYSLPDTGNEFEYLDVQDGEVKKVFFQPFMKRYFHPSLLQQTPYNVKNAWKSFQHTLLTMVDAGLMRWKQAVEMASYFCPEHLPNKFSLSAREPRHLRCRFREYVRQRCVPILIEDARILQSDVEYDVDGYYHYLESLPDRERRDIAGSLFAYLKRQSKVEHQSKL